MLPTVIRFRSGVLVVYPNLVSLFSFGLSIRFPSNLFVLVDEDGVFLIDLVDSQYLLFLSR